ncbi:MAG: ATP synthase subunit I [Cyanobacteria bacterium P01_A01_bin.114]
MDSPDESSDLTSAKGESERVGQASEGLPLEPNSSIEEYFQLQRELFAIALIATGVVFFSVWVFYTLNIALNYFLGACIGVVYLKMLAKGVEKLGREKSKIGKNQLALFIGLIVVASQLYQLQIIPIFLGFLTYKVALIVYMFRTLLTP